MASNGITEKNSKSKDERQEESETHLREWKFQFVRNSIVEKYQRNSNKKHSSRTKFQIARGIFPLPTCKFSLFFLPLLAKKNSHTNCSRNLPFYPFVVSTLFRFLFVFIYIFCFTFCFAFTPLLLLSRSLRRYVCVCVCVWELCKIWFKILFKMGLSILIYWGYTYNDCIHIIYIEIAGFTGGRGFSI